MSSGAAVSPETGRIFNTLFKVHRHVGVVPCCPVSVCHGHRPRWVVPRTVRMLLSAVPGRAALCRPSPGGTVTPSASTTRSRRITTLLLLLLPRPEGA